MFEWLVIYQLEQRIRETTKVKSIKSFNYWHVEICDIYPESGLVSSQVCTTKIQGCDVNLGLICILMIIKTIHIKLDETEIIT